MGDAVNVAARLESVSSRGQIFVNETTYSLTNRLFVFEEKAPIAVKGKAEPLKVYQLLSARDLGQSQRGLTGMEASLIGREYETQMLIEAYRTLAQRTGHIAVIAGDAGLGKTRLVRETMKQIQKDEAHPSALWMFARGLAYRQSFSNRLFVDILYNYLQIPEDSDDSLVWLKLKAMGDDLFGERKTEVIPYLATLLGVKMDGQADIPVNDPQLLQQRLFLALGEWLEVLSARQPVVIVFEDLHWADASSIALIEYVFTLTIYNPILLVCVTRPERVSNFWEVKSRGAREYSQNFTDLTLWPLTDEESRQLIRQLLKIEPMPQDLEQLLLSRAEGNPLFLEEVLRSLIEDGTITREDDHWAITRSVVDIDIPNTLQGVLTARIDRLEEPVKRVLQVAAAIGRVFPRFVLAPIVNEPEILEKALVQLELADLIEVQKREPEPEYIFKHVLTYETAYNSMLHQRRQMLHRQIADFMATRYWLLGEQFAPIVADHYYKSESWPRALRYFSRAAEAAIQSFANQEAIEFYTQALEVVGIIGPQAELPAVLSIYEGRAKTYTRLGEPQKAVEDYKAMLDNAETIGDNAAQMRALNGIGALQASHHNFGQAAAYFQQALTVARRIGDPPGIAETLNQLGNFNYNLGQLELATQFYRESYELSLANGSEIGRVTSEDGLTKIVLEQGEILAGLTRYEEEIVPVYRRLGYRGGLMNSLATVLMARIYLADYAAACTTAEELLELHKRFGDYYRVPLVKYYQGLGQLYQGWLEQAGATLAEGLALAQEQGQKSYQSMGLAWVAYYNLMMGRNDLALELAQQSVQLADELGSPMYIMKAKAILGTAYRHLGQVDEAIAVLEGVYHGVSGMGLVPDEVSILYQLIRAYLDKEWWDKAEQHLAYLTELAGASEMKEFLARSLWLQARVDARFERYESALAALSQASTLSEQIDGRLCYFLVQIQKAYVHQAAGNPTAAKEAALHAQKIQQQLIDDNRLSETDQQNFLNSAYSRRLQIIFETIL
jgi:tetratricopeptide (TPR) repeat protein